MLARKVWIYAFVCADHYCWWRWLRFKNRLAGHGLVGKLKISKPCSISCNDKMLRFAGLEGMERILRVFVFSTRQDVLLHLASTTEFCWIFEKTKWTPNKSKLELHALSQSVTIIRIAMAWSCQATWSTWARTPNVFARDSQSYARFQNFLHWDNSKIPTCLRKYL